MTHNKESNLQIIAIGGVYSVALLFVMLWCFLRHREQINNFRMRFFPPVIPVAIIEEEEPLVIPQNRV